MRMRSLIVIGLLALCACRADASSCIYIWESLDDEVRDHLRFTELIFSGEVVRITKVPDEKSTKSIEEMIENNQLGELLNRDRLTITLRVNEYWKGSFSENIEINTWNASSTDAGYPFEIGGTYLIFTSNAKPTVSSCSLARPMDSAGDILKLLGKSKTQENKKP